MTDPAPKTDPAPATDPPADPAPVVDPPADPVIDPAENEDARVTRANQQAAASRVALREAQKQLEEQGKTLAALAAVFNPGADPAADPATQVAEATTKAEQLTTRVGQLEAELLVHSIAGDAGASANALLDSRAFSDALHAIDAAAPDYPELVAGAIKSAVSKNPSLAAAAGQAPARGGAPGAGQGPATPGGVTQDQFDAMGLSQRNELYQTNPDLYRKLAAGIR